MKAGKQTECKLGWQILIVPICRKRDDDNADLLYLILLRRTWIADRRVQPCNRSIEKETASPRGDIADTKSLPLDLDRKVMVDADK